MQPNSNVNVHSISLCVWFAFFFVNRGPCHLNISGRIREGKSTLATIRVRQRSRLVEFAISTIDGIGRFYGRKLCLCAQWPLCFFLVWLIKTGVFWRLTDDQHFDRIFALPDMLTDLLTCYHQQAEIKKFP